MPGLSLPKTALEAPEPFEDGIYQLRFEGFTVKRTKKGNSLNLNPKLVVVNHPKHNGKRHWENLNWQESTAFIVNAFCHAFGQLMVESGDSVHLPGNWIGWNDEDPSKATLVGPLTGAVAQVELVQRPARDESGNVIPGRMRNVIKQYFCAIPGCTEPHPKDLAKNG